jgi:hypothetical protein
MASMTAMAMEEMEERAREQQKIGQEPRHVSPVLPQQVKGADERD